MRLTAPTAYRLRTLVLHALLAALAPRVRAAGAVAHAQRPLNLDFERRAVAYADRPWGWSLGWSAFGGGPRASFTLDTIVHVQGKRSLRIVASDSGANPAERTLMLQLPAAFGNGHALVVRGAMRARHLRGRAAVLLEAWKDRAIAAGDTATIRGDGSSADTSDGWHRFTLRIRSPADEGVHSIVISLLVAGSGTAWFDDLQLTVDGARMTAIPTDGGPAATPAELAWLAARSAPLTRVAPEASEHTPLPPDLAMVSRITGKARVVALGESTHGTREFFEVKLRLLQHLVRHEGFDLFAIEANQLAVEQLNAYVGGAPGTARDAMRVLFRVWNTEGMLALVEWMRGYNATAPARPVHFVGYDMQDHQLPADSLEAFVRRSEPTYVGRVRALTGEYRNQPSYATPQVADDKRSTWRARADSLWREVAARRDRWLSNARSRNDSLSAEWAVHDADLFRQAALLNESLNSPDRDSLMAANLDWALRTLYPASRAVAWAHDVHVSHGGDPARSFNQGAQMGAVLAHHYGHDYRAFSLLTRAGEYSASRSFSDYPMATMEADIAPAGSVEALLAQVRRPPGSVGIVTDLRVDEHDPQGRVLWRPRPIRSIGYAAFDFSFDLRAVMPLEFDGVIFIDRTTASRLLPPRPR